MSDETAKSMPMRIRRGDIRRYFGPTVIDIGCGRDLLRIEGSEVTPWDWEHGDAQKMEGIADESYHTVYSSHCLEHVHDWREALRNWVRILLPSGNLYVVIPEFTVYEKRAFPPSRYNGDHKAAFALIAMDGSEGTHERERVFSIGDVLAELQKLGMAIEDVWLEIGNFDWGRFGADQTLGNAQSQVTIAAHKGAVRPRLPGIRASRMTKPG